MNGHLPVIDILRASGPVGLYIGGSGIATARVFPGEPLQGAEYPLIRVEVFDGEAFDTKSGPAYVDHDIVKVFCDSDDETQASRLSKAVRTALEGISGTYNGIEIENIRYLSETTYSANLTNKVVRTHEADYQVRVVVN
jgi:hypothetical protein